MISSLTTHVYEKVGGGLATTVLTILFDAQSDRLKVTTIAT
jgi:hypothetical protein